MTTHDHPRDLDPDRETTAAINALAHRMRELGIGDPEWHAREFVWAMRNRGWRPTPARQGQEWRPGITHRPSQNAHEHAAEARRLLAESRPDCATEAAWLGRVEREGDQ